MPPLAKALISLGRRFLRIIEWSLIACHVSTSAHCSPRTGKPDHVLRNKRIAAIIGDDYNADITRFRKDYENYFKAHKKGDLNILDCAPRWAVWKNKGLLAFGSTEKEIIVR